MTRGTSKPLLCSFCTDPTRSLNFSARLGWLKLEINLEWREYFESRGYCVGNHSCVILTVELKRDVKWPKMTIVPFTWLVRQKCPKNQKQQDRQTWITKTNKGSHTSSSTELFGPTSFLGDLLAYRDTGKFPLSVSRTACRLKPSKHEKSFHSQK
jgi:hypothetical protein